MFTPQYVCACLCKYIYIYQVMFSGVFTPRRVSGHAVALTRSVLELGGLDNREHISISLILSAPY